MSAVPHLLIVLPQLPFDPASGAARSATTVGEFLADAGFEVATLATTASEAASPLNVSRLLSDLDIDAERRNEGDREVIRFSRRRVQHTLLDTGTCPVGRWEWEHGAKYDRLFDEVLAGFRPNVVVIYGGSVGDLARQQRAHASSAQVVFALYNACYSARASFAHADRVITPSAFLSDHYRRTIGLRSDPLPTPLWSDDVIATEPVRQAVTMVNPCPEKGMMFFARLAGQLGERRPDIPIEVYASRGGASLLLQAAYLGGIDLGAHPALAFRDIKATPAALFARTRLLVVPSLVEDAAPRVIAEALVNGIPPLGSDRGGIPEMCADAGWVLPISRSVEPALLRPPPASAVQAWVETIIQLFDDAPLWQQASARARQAGACYLPAATRPLYLEYFERLIAGERYCSGPFASSH